ncbi:MAG: RsmD family RNA methyltransferase, partial [Gammaproteobacteria bacterium]
ILGARCLDLFAGSGALGLEALSRGAAFLYAVEQNRTAAQRLRDNIILLHEGSTAEVVQGDALRVLRTPPETPFDIVFLDPPFADGLLPEVCRLLEDRDWLALDAVIYLEQDAGRGWLTHREGSAGQSAQRLLRRNITG